jgi:hypothetical protein
MKTTLPIRREHSALRHLAHSFAKTFRTLLLASGLLIVFSMQANAQDDSWTLQTTVNNVDFFHKLVDCGDRKAVLIKFDNKNSFDVKISWKQIIGTKEVPNTENESDQRFEMSLTNGVIGPNGCQDSEFDNLVITPFEVEPTYMATIRNFSFSNITAERVN